MKLREMYTNAMTTLNKDGNDGFITLDRLNTLLPSLNHEFIRKKIEELFYVSEIGVATPKGIHSSKIIQKLVKKAGIVQTDSASYSTAPLPTDYMYWRVCFGHILASGVDGNTWREVELIDESELMDRQTNILGKNLMRYPAATIGDDIIYFYPSVDLRVDEITYIKKPYPPFLDYYISANLEVVFLDAGASLILSGGKEYRDGSTGGSKSSQTAELEIPDDFHPEFLDLLIEKLSIPLDDQYKNQYAMAKQQKEDQK